MEKPFVHITYIQVREAIGSSKMGVGAYTEMGVYSGHYSIS